jgi:hypothetical protein
MNEGNRIGVIKAGKISDSRLAVRGARDCMSKDDCSLELWSVNSKEYFKFLTLAYVNIIYFYEAFQGYPTINCGSPVYLVGCKLPRLLYGVGKHANPTHPGILITSVIWRH